MMRICFCITATAVYLTLFAITTAAYSDAADGPSISIKSQDKPVLLGGPIPVTLIFHNRSEHSLQFLFDCARPKGLTCNIKEGEGATVREQAATIWTGQIPCITVGKHDEHSMTLYLNQFIRFTKPGTFAVNYDFAVYYRTTGSELKQATAQGTINIILVEGDKDMLDKVLKAAAEGLKHSDWQKQMDAASALCYLDHELSLRYIARIFETNHPGAKALAIRELRRFHQPAANEIIRNVVTMHNQDAYVTRVGLEILAERNLLSFEYIYSDTVIPRKSFLQHFPLLSYVMAGFLLLVLGHLAWKLFTRSRAA